MKKTILLAILSIVALVPSLRAQVVTTEPTPLQEDSENVVVYFHADQGNKGMMGLSSDTKVYAHTGVKVIDGDGIVTDWKYAPSWNVDLPKYLLSYVSEDLWKLDIGNIREFYGVAEDETVLRLCFVFRTSKGTKEGKEADGSDIYVDVVESGFQLTLTNSSNATIVGASRPSLRFSVATTATADITLSVNDTQIASVEQATSLQSVYTFPGVGTYEVKATATADGQTISRTMTILYPRDSQAAGDTSIPPMGVTKNSDGTYTFCLAAPGKSSVIVVGSWNGYMPKENYVMDYVDESKDGYDLRYFKVNIPASETGSTFGYYYMVDGSTAVGDPYARLVLDPYNDRYITSEVYPDMPAYPEGRVPNNTLVAWYGDNLLDYDWQDSGFTAAPKEDLIIYEMLFRDFTGTEGESKGNGTVRQAIEKLGYLKDLGVNAIELMPISEFNGNNSWGYNPNFYFATDKAYGTPQDYKEFIDRAHQLGMAVVLDVVLNQSDGLHPWYKMYPISSNPFYNKTAPHAYSVLNDWNQDNPLVMQQWLDMVKFWISEYHIDGYRFDLVKGLGDNDSYGSGTEAYNASRVARMKKIHDAMRTVNPDAYFINENLAGSKEENEMAQDGEMNWANVNNAGCQFAMGYSSESNLNRMWAVKDSRTAGSTVAYLESHDEQRMGYKQIKWGVSTVKNDHKVCMQRLGSAAAQMILVPGAHMIWQFSELGNDQNTKDAKGGNDTSPKIVNWNALNDPDNAALYQCYRELITIRLENPELFAADADYSLNLSAWATGRYINTTAGNKELYVVINPNTSGDDLTLTVPFKSDNNGAYHIASKSHDSNPTFDAAAKTVTVSKGCYAVVTTTDITGVEDVTLDTLEQTRIYAQGHSICVKNCEGLVEVYTLDGKNVAKSYGNASIDVAPGVYVVRAAGNTAKVIVR